MNNVDKCIKLNFSLVKGELIGLFCCTLLATFGVFLPSMAPMVILYAVVMIVLFIRTLSKICDKSLFGEGAVLYQSLPFSTEEVVVAKTFVITVATTICWAGIMGGLSFGMSIINDGSAEYAILLTFVELLDKVGAVSAPIVILKLITDGFFYASELFAFTVTLKIATQYADRLFIALGFMAVVAFKNKYLTDLLMAIAENNLLIVNLMEIIVSIALAVIASLITKYCLDKRYILS